jgi:transposase
MAENETMKKEGMGTRDADQPPSRYYDEEFKWQAVKTLVESGRTVTDIAKTLGIEQSTLHRWKEKYAKKTLPVADARDALNGPDAEMAVLRREIECLRESVSLLRSVVKKCLLTQLKAENLHAHRKGLEVRHSVEEL